MSEPVDYIARTKALYASLNYPDYKWVTHTDAPPWSVLTKPLSECRVGLICSGGIYCLGQTAFHSQDDISLRLIATDIELDQIRITHFAYDERDARRDPNIVLPLEPLKNLRNEGFFASLAEHAYTFMGGIYSSRKVATILAPELTRRCLQDEIDLALLVPA